MGYLSEDRLAVLREQPDQVRALATKTLQRRDLEGALTWWEGDNFLPSIAAREGDYTDPQIDKTFEIDKLSEPCDSWDGMSTRLVLQTCFEARIDLDEEDEDWIVELHQRESGLIFFREVRRLYRLWKQLNP